MTVTYVLMVLLLNGHGTGQPMAFSQEFDSRTTCEAAKDSIREKVQGVKIALLTCEKK